MSQILTRRVARDALLALSLPLSIFFHHDLLDYPGICLVAAVLSYLPYLVFLSLLGIVLFTVRDYLKKEKTTATPAMAFHLSFLLGILVFSTLFAKQISVAREIIHFRLHQEDFMSLVSVFEEEDCLSEVPIYCIETIDLPAYLEERIGRSSMSILADSETRSFVLPSRSSTLFTYIEGQNDIPSPHYVAYYYMYCFYQLGENWFLCSASMD